MDKKINVLHVFKQMNRGGAETLIMNVMKNSDNKNIKFFFLVTTEEEGHFDNEIEKIGGEVVCVTSPKKNIFKFIKELKEVIKSNHINVVHSHVYTFSGVVLKVASIMNVSVKIAHSHTTSSPNRSIYRVLYFRLMQRLISKNSTNLLGCSNDACNKLFRETEKENRKIKLLRNGIDLDKFKESNTFGLKEKYNLSNDSIIIGHVGSFRYAKNHGRIIEIFNELYKKNKKYNLFLVGDGPLKSDIEKKISEYDLETNIHLLGLQDNIPSILKDLDVFLFPSHYEGLGLALIEAQAAGINCVTSTRVPKEADLGLGMISFIDLGESNLKWSENVRKSAEKKSISFKEIENKIRNMKYEISSTVHDLEKIYTEAITENED